MRPALAIIVLVLASGTSAQAADDWGALYGYVAWTSDYRFYGLSESNRQPAVQAGLHWVAPENFYAGIFVSRVNFRDFRKTSVETDFYAGRHFTFDANELNLQLLTGLYPDSAGHPSYAAPGVILPTYNFVEATATLTHTFANKLSVSGKLLGEPSFNAAKPAAWSVIGSANYPVRGWLAVSANVGHQWASAALGRTYWDLGMTATHEWQWALDLRYFGSDAGRSHCFHTNWCGSALVLKVTYTFQAL